MLLMDIPRFPICFLVCAILSVWFSSPLFFCTAAAYLLIMGLFRFLVWKWYDELSFRDAWHKLRSDLAQSRPERKRRFLYDLGNAPFWLAWLFGCARLDAPPFYFCFAAAVYPLLLVYDYISWKHIG